MKINLLQVGVLVGGLSLGIGPVASAIPLMTLDDGAGNTVSLIGGGTPTIAGSVSTTSYSVAPLGTVCWNGSIGVWSLTMELGVTKPFQGSAAVPAMSLSFSSTSTGAGTLTVKWSDTDFGPSSGAFKADIGGTLNTGGGSLSYSTFYSLANAVPAPTVLTAAMLFTTPGGFSGTGTAAAGALPPPYSLTEMLVLHHTGAGLSSGDAQLLGVVPDSGSTFLLLGAGLLGIAGACRLQKDRKSVLVP